WRRRTNENTNGLLRQYFPSGLSISTYSQHDLDVIALRLNSRPRKTPGFPSPRATINGAVAATRLAHCGFLESPSTPAARAPPCAPAPARPPPRESALSGPA